MNISEIATSMQLSDDEYLPIWSAMMETARGRRFLSEFARRTRSAETRTLLDSVQKLERALITARERLPDPAQAPATSSHAEAAQAELNLIQDVLQQAVPALTEASRINARIIADLQDAADDIHEAASAIRLSLDNMTYEAMPPGAIGQAVQQAHIACCNIEARAADVSEIVAVQQISDEQSMRATDQLERLLETPLAAEDMTEASNQADDEIGDEDGNEAWDLAADENDDACDAPTPPSAITHLTARGPELATANHDAMLAQSPAVQRLIQEITTRLLQGRQKRATG